jgi:hypothetical protein
MHLQFRKLNRVDERLFLGREEALLCPVVLAIDGIDDSGRQSQEGEGGEIEIERAPKFLRVADPIRAGISLSWLKPSTFGRVGNTYSSSLTT